MRGAFYRLLLTFVAAGLGIAVWVYSDYAKRTYFKDNLVIIKELQTLETDVSIVESEVLRSSAFLYYNYDTIHQALARVETHLDFLNRNAHIRLPAHAGVLHELSLFVSEFRKYRETIDQHLTLNASLKNSIIYIPALQIRAYDILDVHDPTEQRLLWLISRINASIFVAKNALDTDFVGEIKSYRKELRAIAPFVSQEKKRLLETLTLHLDHFFEAFPKYMQTLHRLLDSPIRQHAARIRTRFQETTQAELSSLDQTSRILLTLYLLSLAIVVVFIFHTQRENRRLFGLKSKLECSLVTDTLTGLKNRTAFQQRKEKMLAPCLVLINIDRFKHINEFYGAQIGDIVLRKTADRLRSILAKQSGEEVFRLGGDDFGVLCEQDQTDVDFEALARCYHDALDGFHVEAEGVRIDLAFTLGLSRESDRLFETADMALKFAKRSQRKLHTVYSDEIDQRESIESNIKTIQTVRDALAEDRILPYFQPIYNIRKHQTTRHEALARIEPQHEGDDVLAPFHFLDAAKEAKLSGRITLEILRKTLGIVQKHAGTFSVNISAADVEDLDNRNEIIALLEAAGDLSGRIVFEILESEEIGDYEAMDDFIRSVKRFGCEVAIDDFGSGYSNFEKILKLDIDYLKLDGSLIKKIDYDRHTEWIVRTILEFARHAGFKSVAEYVHSKAVYDKVVELGFDYAQGYFIGKPTREVDAGRRVEIG